MREVSDAYLLTMAEVSATLIGLFLVGAFFYADTGLPRLGAARNAFEPYLRAGIRITLIVLAIPLLLSLTLVVLEPVWSRLLFLGLSAVVLTANVDTLRTIPDVWKTTRSTGLLVMEVLTTAGVIALVILPWALGGPGPAREHLNWAILIAFGAGFLSLAATVMSVFDLARTSSSEAPRDSVRTDETSLPHEEAPRSRPTPGEPAAVVEPNLSPATGRSAGRSTRTRPGRVPRST